MANRDELRDPDTGAPLDEERMHALEHGDAQAYGDVALTRYYDPDADLGLSTEWDALDSMLAEHGLAGILTGSGVGPEGARFDPGRQGAFVQSPEDVRANLRALDALMAPLANEAREAFAPARAMLVAAASRGEGLYLTF
jgi:hypothetical protein